MTSTAVPRRRAGGLAGAATAVRVAIYARKSTDKNSDAEYTTIDRQLEACRAYIASQRELGWIETGAPYADPGFSAATLNRPAMRRLLADVQAGAIDVIVAYRMDRLSRRQLDMLTVLDLFERHGVRFVSVTEPFTTATPIGRAMISLLGVFAQMERETIVERIKDKMSGARRRGKWQGGRPVLGYDVADKRLAVSDAEAVLVREIFETYLRIGCVTDTLAELKRRAITNKRWQGQKGQPSGGQPFSRTSLRNLLGNRLYRGETPVDGDWVAGEHKCIVPQALWDAVQGLLASRGEVSEGGDPHSPSGATLQSLLRCGTCGSAMTPAHAKKGPRRYQYYICVKLKRFGRTACPGSRVAAGEVEARVIDYLRQAARDPAVLAATVEAARNEQTSQHERLTAELRRHQADMRRLHAERLRLVEAVASGDSKAVSGRLAEVEQAAEATAQRLTQVQVEIERLATHALDKAVLRKVIDAFDPVWTELGSAEKARVMGLLFERVTYDAHTSQLGIAFRAGKLRELLNETQH